jgi:3-isopropylmalate dehydrogenase
VHLADKSNAMRYGQALWRRIFFEVARDFPALDARAEYVDALAYRLLREPQDYDVIVTNNLFGDILSDLAAALAGGLGMAPSANVRPGHEGSLGLFEPVHGSAPELVGRDLANPAGALLSTALLLGHLGFTRERAEVECAVAAAVTARRCTPDVGGTLGTAAAGAAVLDLLATGSP